MSHRMHRLIRRGTTVLEVLFATGIVVIGILGIASLLPLAARNANLANEASEGQTYAQRYYSDFIVRGFNSSANWRRFNDLPAFRRFVPFVHGPLASGTSGGPSGSGTVRVGNRHAVCIDPGFYADPVTISEIRSGAFTNAQAYRPGLFPYYQDNFNPLTDPTNPGFFTAGSVADDRVRLLRLSLFDPVTARDFSAKQIEQLFLSSDDLAITADDNDKSLPPIRVYDVSGGRALSRLQYSWLATLSPREYALGEVPDTTAPEQRYTLSIVVMHRRERAFFVPTGVDIPQGERVLSVTGHPGSFIGGSGGSITVSASTAVDDTLRIGDWLMLARYSAPTAAGTRSAIVRWYRIIGVDPEPTVAGGVWSKNLVLEGPDWIFTGSPPGVPSFDQATVVSNVVTVLERVVDVQ